MSAPTRLLVCFAVTAMLGLATSGCGGASDSDYSGQHPDYASALAGSPKPLATLHKQANKLLSGGPDAYKRRVAALRGYPVVVNVWASWCGPCRLEFPVLQRLAARYGKRVAFFGINSQDSDDAASTFLDEAPVPYPSYTDPDEDIVDYLDASRGLPATVFYDSSGEITYRKLGPYANDSELEADVRRYALSS